MNRVQKKFVLDALDNEEALSEWEHGFVQSLADLPDDRDLSAKQNEILNRISQKINDR